jgi:hypothetical protein
MLDQEKQVILNIDAGPINDAEELEHLAQWLREEIMELSVEKVEVGHEKGAPEKAKASTPLDWSTLIITLAASGGVLTVLIGLLQSWVTRHERSKVCVEIDGDKLEVAGKPTEEQKQLIDAWLRRHRGFVVDND